MKTNVLMIAVCGISYEGITSVIRNYTEQLDKNQFSPEFVSPFPVLPRLREDFEAMGPVHVLPDRQKQLPAYLKALGKLLRDRRFQVVHIHGNSGTMVFEALTARLCGVKKVIVHGHSTACDHPAVNRLLVIPMKCLASRCLSCSQAAGTWLYGRSRFTVLQNAIQLEKFRFDPEVRQKYRKELGLEGRFVIGHIGHFTETKNQDFILDFFRIAYEKNRKLSLVLVSDGPNFEKVQKKARDLGLQDAVQLLGRRGDTPALYQAMDLFILPSKWEGLPVVMLEAQAAALPLLVSANITKDAACTPYVTYKALEDGAESWAEAVSAREALNREALADACQQDVRQKGFDIRQEARHLEEIYLG